MTQLSYLVRVVATKMPLMLMQQIDPSTKVIPTPTLCHLNTAPTKLCNNMQLRLQTSSFGVLVVDMTLSSIAFKDRSTHSEVTFTSRLNMKI